ncbi:MAG: vWA domain-containing protein [Phycisphaeraceae bacterium]
MTASGLPRFRSLSCAALLIAAGSAATPAAADIVPQWDDLSPTVVDLPASGTTTYDASGTVSIDFATLDAVLVYDASGSMGTRTTEFAPNGGNARGDWAEAGASAFVNTLPDGARVGLTRFTSSPREIVAIDTLGPADSSQRAELLNEIDRMPRGGGTDIDEAILFAADQLNNAPNASNSKHIVLVTDGRDSRTPTLDATADVIANGIGSVNTVGLPGADTLLLQEIADAGNGVFVDGTDLSNLIDNFENILNSAETIDKLEIFKDGILLAEPTVDANHAFNVPLQIVEGENIFTARATSNLGNVRDADLVIVGNPVPEPGSLALLTLGGLLIARRRNR